ncbi:carbohydrate binding domain-containing protein [Glaciecola sp. SC05]|uniref:carbohydrate binding domain-containing protein n=1 Tax=Glaciecola sp. SC05 TaxID=1987355 RepID=UPI0035277833
MKVSTQPFKLKRLVLITGLVFGMSACNTDDLAPPPPPPPVNSAPQILSMPTTGANEGQPYIYTLTATDLDADSLSYSLSTSTWLSIDPATGAVSGTPTAADVGDNEVTVSVSDGTDTTTQTFTVVVVAALPNNVAPVITSSPLLMGAVDSSYSYTITATDGNFDDLDFASVTLPAWGMFDTSTGILSGTPDIPGNYPVELTVSDGEETVSQSFTISVTGPDVITTELTVFENMILPEWQAWTDNGGPFELVTVDGDPERDQATKFTLTKESVAGFTARESGGAVGGMPFDASGFVANGQLTFELQLLVPTTVPVNAWFLKLEAGSGASFAEVRLSSSLEGHAAPQLNTWQTYTFPLSSLISGSSLNASAIDLFMVFPSYSDAAGASYLIDNFKLVSVISGNPGGGDGGTDPNGPELLTNGDFENGLASWKADIGSVVMDDGDNVFFVEIAAASGNVFDINQSQIFDIEEGETYVFSFRAKASQARTMIAGLGLNGGDFTNISETVSLTTEWQTFTTEVEAIGIGGVGSRVLFDMGVGIGDIFIDDVSVKVKDGAPPPPPVDNGAELLTNGDFEDGLASWRPDVGSVIVEDGNSVFEAIITSASDNVFDINQSQIFDIVEGETYVFTYRARASEARTIIAGLGLNGGDFTNISETVSLTTEWQTFTTEVVAVGIGGVGSRVLFDMGVGVGNVYLDDVSVKVKGGDAPAGQLLTNGGFDDGLASWRADVGSVIMEDGNSVFEAIVNVATDNVFDINQSQVFDIIEGETYRFSYRARASQARTIVAGLGLNGGDFTNISETVSLTTEWQTFTTDIVAVGIGGVGSRVLFDMGVGIGNVYLDDVSVMLVEGE